MTILLLDREKLNRIICAHTTAYSMTVYQSFCDASWWNEIGNPKEMRYIQIILKKKFKSFVGASIPVAGFHIRVELSDRNEALLFKLAA